MSCASLSAVSDSAVMQPPLLPICYMIMCTEHTAEVGVKYRIRIWIYETNSFQNFRMKKRSAPNPRSFPKDIHRIDQKLSFLLFFPWPQSGQFEKNSNHDDRILIVLRVGNTFKTCSRRLPH